MTSSSFHPATPENPGFKPGALSAEFGHLSYHLAHGEEVAPFPGPRHTKNYKWLSDLANMITLDMRMLLNPYRLLHMVVYAKHLPKLVWHWESLGALIELWHPRTHTFIFQEFEATVLLEEISLFLGWSHLEHADDLSDLLPWEKVLTDIVQDKREICQMMDHRGIRVDRLAHWIMRTIKAKNSSAERLVKGLTLCFGGVFLFPTSGDVLNREHVGILSLLWEGYSITPQVLSFLYQGLTAMSLEGAPQGSLFLLQLWTEMRFKFDLLEEPLPLSRIFQRSALYPVRSLYRSNETVKNLTANLKTRTDWRNFLNGLTIENFVFTPIMLKGTRFRIRDSKDDELWLMSPSHLVLYQSHRCHLQVGLPRQIPFTCLKNKLIEELNGSVEDNAALLKKLSKIWRRHSISIERHLDIQEDQGQLTSYLAYLKEIHPKMNSLVIARH